MMSKKYKSPSCNFHQKAAAAAGASYGSHMANAAAVLDHFEDTAKKIRDAGLMVDQLRMDVKILAASYDNLSTDDFGDSLLDPLAPLPDVVEIKGRLSHVVAELTDLHFKFTDLWQVYEASIREGAGDPGRSPSAAGGGREVVVNHQK